MIGRKMIPLFSDNKSYKTSTTTTNATSISWARPPLLKNFEKNEVGNAHWRDMKDAV